jgi:hypothetical protein
LPARRGGHSFFLAKPAFHPFFASLRELFFFSRKNAETCPPAHISFCSRGVIFFFSQRRQACLPQAGRKEILFLTQMKQI